MKHIFLHIKSNLKCIVHFHTKIFLFSFIFQIHFTALNAQKKAHWWKIPLDSVKTYAKNALKEEADRTTSRGESLLINIKPKESNPKENIGITDTKKTLIAFMLVGIAHVYNCHSYTFDNNNNNNNGIMGYIDKTGSHLSNVLVDQGEAAKRILLENGFRQLHVLRPTDEWHYQELP